MIRPLAEARSRPALLVSASNPESRWPGDYLVWDEGRLYVRPDLAPVFESLGWTTFDAIFESDRHRVFRRVEERENGRVELPTSDSSRILAGYLKRHRGRRLKRWLKRALRGEGTRPAGLAEADAVGWLQQAGAATVSVIAAGARPGRRPWQADSFFLSEALDGTPADDFWKQRFGDRRENDAAARRDALAALAGAARATHRARLCHRDFYWCHFFLDEQPSGRFRARLIDLQRVRRRPFLWWRWRLKDLAQFVFSAPEGLVDGADLTEWYRLYRGKEKLGLLDWLDWSIIRARACFYRWKDGSP